MFISQFINTGLLLLVMNINFKMSKASMPDFVFKLF